MNKDPESPSNVVQMMDPELKTTLERLEQTLQTRWAEEAQTFKKEISTKPLQPEQQIFAFLPHQLAKTSIFFPMSDRDLKEENRKINKLEHETPWGKIVVEGIKLSIAEEDFFLTLMKIAKNKIQEIKGSYVLETHMGDIVNLLYGRSGYTQQSYDRIEEALQHFQLVRFELTTGEWKKRGKARLIEKTVRSIGNIVQSYKYDKDTKKLVIKFNSEFFAYFLESMLTNINYTIRRQLKKDGSKALLRFLSTHNKPGRMHLLTVLNAINFNTNQPLFRLRSRMKQFISELKKHGALGSKTRLYHDDTVFFDPVSGKKSLPD